MILLGNPGWPQTHTLPACVSRVLRLQVCDVTTLRSSHFFSLVVGVDVKASVCVSLLCLVRPRYTGVKDLRLCSSLNIQE